MRLDEMSFSGPAVTLSNMGGEMDFRAVASLIMNTDLSAKSAAMAFIVSQGVSAHAGVDVANHGGPTHIRAEGHSNGPVGGIV